MLDTHTLPHIDLSCLTSLDFTLATLNRLYLITLNLQPQNCHQVAVTCSFDKTVRVWDLESGTETAKYEGHTDKVQDYLAHKQPHPPRVPP